MRYWQHFYFSPYHEWSERGSRLNEMSLDYLIVNTGSTAGYKAFDYSLWKDKGINLGYQSQPLYYDFEMLKKYSDHIVKNAIIFICIEHFKFYLDYYEEDKSDYKYYFWLDKEQIRTYNRRTDWLIQNASFLLQPKNTLCAVKYKIKNILFKGKKNKEEIFCEDKDIQYSHQWADSWNEEFGWKDGQFVRKEQLETIHIIEERLLDMIDYCFEHKWHPQIIVLPMSPNLTCLLSDNVMNPGLWEPLDRVSKLRNMKIIDFYHDSRFADWKLYDNALVLNENGRKLFNSIVQDEMLYQTYS